MADDMLAQRVAANAAAVGVPIDTVAAERVARAVGPALTRFAAAHVTLAMEVEPATFAAVQRGESER